MHSDRKPFLLFIYLFVTRYFEFLIFGVLKYRLLIGKEDKERVLERKGIYKVKRPEGQLIWFNAASVGEVLSILQLIRLLSEKNKNLNFLITSTTVTSARIIAKVLPKNCLHQFSPLDTFRVTRSFFTHWKPDLAIFVESEFWPRLLLETKALRIPLGLINARIEDRSFKKWKKFSQTAKRLVRLFDFAFAQDKKTCGRLLSLGMNQDVLMGTFSLKSQANPLSFDETELQRLKNIFLDRTIWVAASTHLGEEEVLAKAQKKLHSDDKKNLLILAPRHPERGNSIAKELVSMGLEIAIRSQNQEVHSGTEIYLADTMGELGLWYNLSNIVFLGGSIVDNGGHNPYEPCRFGTAIMHGPFVYNFQEIYDLLRSSGVATMVENSESLVDQVKFLKQPEKASKLGGKGIKLVNSLTDKSQLIVNVINSFV